MIFRTVFFMFVFFICTYVSASAALQFQMNEGRLELKTTDVTAMTSTKYVTTAWVVHGQPRHGNPTNGQHSVISKIAKSYSFPEDPSPGTLVTSFFEIDEAEMTHALINAGLENMKHNSTFYISGIFQIVENGKLSATCYDTLNGIRGARDWYNPDVFTQYYDIKVRLDSAVYPLKVTYKNELGDTMRTGIVEMHKAGDLLAQKLDEGYSFAGDDYRILNSYAIYQNDPHKKQWIADRSVLIRNFTMPVGLFEIIAVYRKVEHNQVTATIGSNIPGKEKYFVEKAIPAGKPLYVTIRAQPIRIHHKFKLIKGTFTHKVQLKRKITREWEEWSEGKWVKQISTVVRDEIYNVPIDYSYWKIENFQVFKWSGANLTNHFFKKVNASISLTNNEENQISVPNVEKIFHSKHVWFPETQTVIMKPEYLNGGKLGPPQISLLSKQQLSTLMFSPLKVRNDRLHIDSHVIMNDEWFVQHAKSPESVNASLNNQSLKITRIGISSNAFAANGNYVSAGNVEYHQIDAVEKMKTIIKVNVSSINPISVHTPLILSLAVKSDEKWLQVVNPQKNTNYLVMGKPFTLRLSNDGNHIDAKGYQKINSNEHVAKREVRFSFDAVYNGKVFVRHQWYPLPVDTNTFTFLLLNQSKAGSGMIEIRDSSNACLRFACQFQDQANLNRGYSGVYQRMNVEKVGTITRFRITSIDDVAAPNDEHWTAKQLPVKVVNSNKRRTSNIYYHLQTTGDYHQPGNCIRLKKRYFHVNRDGKNRQEVDLYLKRFNNKMSSYRLTKIIDNEEKLVTKHRYYVSPDQAIQMWQNQFSISYGTILFSRSTKQMISRPGYLIVHFDFFAEKTCSSPQKSLILRYNNQPFGNMWLNEGYMQRDVYGDIAMFNWNLSDNRTHFITN
jgi:hypothetical protein